LEIYGRNVKFAVTGGAGFIGNNIVHLLLNQGHQVKVIDNLHTGKMENLSDVIEKIEFENIDIRDHEKLSHSLKNIDGIFHQAALTIVQESFEKEKEYHDVNVQGTENIFKIAKKEGIKVVYASSSSIYGNTEKIPIKENFPRKPINPYGMTKLNDEFLAEKYCLEGVKIIGLRYFNVYGIGQTGSYAGVITKFLNKLKESKSPIIYGGGNQIRDFIFVKDVALANLSAMESDAEDGFYNIGTGTSVSILNLAEKMIKLFKLNIKPIFNEPLVGDVMKSQADTTLTKSKLKWNYKTELDNGLQVFLN
jgi:UDP-glucose 4-epimerase